MTPTITAIVPAHNPRPDYLAATLEGLAAQTLPRGQWRLVLVDNASNPPLSASVDLHSHPGAEIVREERLGLTSARLAGFRHASGEVTVLVDDDNVLAPDYLATAMEIAGRNPHLGTWGGVIAPRFERPELAPPRSLYPLLTLREVASDTWSNDPDHHASTPWGAGLCVRREVAAAYAASLENNPRGLELDLQGSRLLYGGDTDIAYTGCRLGLGKGVFGALRVEHLIPAERCSARYLERVAEGRGYSEILHALVRTGVLPRQERSLSGWLRTLRGRSRGTVLERRVAGAHARGRRAAFAELGRQVNR